MFPGRGGFRGGFRGGGGWRPHGPGPFSGPRHHQPFPGGWGMGPPPGMPAWGGNGPPPRGGFRGGGGPGPRGGFRQNHERKANQDTSSTPAATQPSVKKEEVEVTQSPVKAAAAETAISKAEVKKEEGQAVIGGGAMIKCAPCGIDVIGSETYQQHLTTAEHTTSSQQLQQHPSPSTSKEAISLGSPRKATSHHATSTATSSDVKNDEASAAIATDDGLVVLDAYTSDLNLKLDEPDCMSARPMSNKGFGYMWAGARANYGVSRGRACFEVLIGEQQDVSHLGPEETCPHVVRVGWSVAESSMQLGEDASSFGYGGTGKIAENSRFSNYGAPGFASGDVVASYLDMTSDPITISFSVNGAPMGVAFRIKSDRLQGRALFPHMLSKNTAFTVNFGQMPAPLSGLMPGYPPVGQLSAADGLVRGPLPPSTRQECQVLLMVGLPGAGKTYWAEGHRRDHPEKCYNILGTNTLLDKMKVNGLKRQKNYHGRWEVLIEKCTACFDVLVKIAAKRNRNYILDQTNVFPTARARKIKDFKGMMCKAVVVVPADPEFQRRVGARNIEQGQEIPTAAVDQMKANYVLPEYDESFSEVLYTELSPKEAQLLVQQYNANSAMKGFEMTSGVKNFIERNRKKRAQVGFYDPIGTVVVNVKPETSSFVVTPSAAAATEADQQLPPGVLAMNAALKALKPVESHAMAPAVDTSSSQAASVAPVAVAAAAPEAAVPPGVAAMNAALERQKQQEASASSSSVSAASSTRKRSFQPGEEGASNDHFQPTTSSSFGGHHSSTADPHPKRTKKDEQPPQRHNSNYRDDRSSRRGDNSSRGRRSHDRDDPPSRGSTGGPWGQRDGPREGQRSNQGPGFGQQGYNQGDSHQRGGFDRHRQQEQGPESNQSGFGQDQRQRDQGPNQRGFDHRQRPQQDQGPMNSRSYQRGFDQSRDQVPNQRGFDQREDQGPNQRGFDQRQDQRQDQRPNQRGLDQRPNQRGFDQRQDRGPNQRGFDRREDQGPNQGGFEQRQDQGHNQRGFDQRQDQGPNQRGFDQQQRQQEQGPMNSRSYQRGFDQRQDQRPNNEGGFDHHHQRQQGQNQRGIDQGQGPEEQGWPSYQREGSGFNQQRPQDRFDQPQDQGPQRSNQGGFDHPREDQNWGGPPGRDRGRWGGDTSGQFGRSEERGHHQDTPGYPSHRDDSREDEDDRDPLPQDSVSMDQWENMYGNVKAGPPQPTRPPRGGYRGGGGHRGRGGGTGDMRYNSFRSDRGGGNSSWGRGGGGGSRGRGGGHQDTPGYPRHQDRYNNSDSNYQDRQGFSGDNRGPPQSDQRFPGNQDRGRRFSSNNQRQHQQQSGSQDTGGNVQQQHYNQYRGDPGPNRPSNDRNQNFSKPDNFQSRDFPSTQGERPSNDNSSWGQNPAAPQPGYNSSATGNRPNQPPVRPSYQTGNSYQTGSSNSSNASNTGGYNQYVGPKGNSGGGGYQTGRSTDTSGPSTGGSGSQQPPPAAAGSSGGGGGGGAPDYSALIQYMQNYQKQMNQQ